MPEEDDMTETQSRPRPRPGAAANPPAAPVEPTPRSSRPSGRPALLYGLGAAGLVLALLVALVIVLFVKRSDDSATISKAGRLDAARTSVLAAARKYAIDFTSYDYRNLDAGFRLTEAELTGKFKDQYTTATAALKDTIVKYQATAKSVLHDIGIESVSPSDAVVIAFVDQTITNTTSSTPMVDRNRVRMTLHRKGSGTWLISDLQLP